MQIDYYYSHVSPWSLMGHERLREMASKHGAEIDFIPVSAAIIFPQTGGLPLAKRAPQRQAYRIWELKRWPRILDIEINIEPDHFPIDDRPSTKIAGLIKQQGGDIADLSRGFMSAVWQEQRNITDPDTLIAITDAHGFDGRALLEQSQGEEGERVLQENCDRALAAEVFGMPTYVINGEPFWGQDRLDLVERVLAG